MSGGELTATQIHAVLQELGRRPQARVLHGDVKLVGGTALILQGIGNRPTADIDASYADKRAVNTVVTEIAADYDLASDWLNSNAAAFVPDNATWVELEQLDGLTIRAADTETLLAMKIAPRLRQIRTALHPPGRRPGQLPNVVDDALDAATVLKPETDE